MMKSDFKLQLIEVGIVAVVVFAIGFRGFIFQFLWNSFLIDWAGVALPEIEYWRAVIIMFIISQLLPPAPKTSK